MLIHAHGKIRRKIIHSDAGNEDGNEEPTMVLYRKEVKGKCAMIPLSCAYKYNDPDTMQDRHLLLKSCLAIAQSLDLPLSGQTAARVMAVVQDGLDELIALPPRSNERKPIGEGTLTIDGEKRTFLVDE